MYDALIKFKHAPTGHTMPAAMAAFKIKHLRSSLEPHRLSTAGCST